MQGCFITFEGIDGSGKTTQIKMLYEFLLERGHDVLLTREPGGTSISDSIRALLLDPVNREMKRETEVLLYAASRAQHVREKIKPALERGAIVLCDRFVDASIAYQGYGLQLSREDVIQINQFATGGIQPDRTYFLDVPIEISQKRLAQRFESLEGPDRIEQKPLSYHKRVKEGFTEICRDYADRIVIIDASRSPETVQGDIRENVLLFLQDLSGT
ncbi:dTMP kinase [Aneurinibacillus terranovensis]|uniref:dTMP kinase n=1 Tax=Aneurinibacillus terranovensis TaxID=278991 RepID=UPI000406DE8F|nr:dTMP kinase [Aneurinibacillus terranovensis]